MIYRLTKKSELPDFRVAKVLQSLKGNKIKGIEALKAESPNKGGR